MNKAIKFTIAGIAISSGLGCCSEVEATSSQQYKVTGTSALMIRDIKDQKYIIEKLPEGSVVTKIKDMKNQKGWFYVETPSGKRGVCSGLYLKSVNGQSISVAEANTYYTTEKLNLRTGAGTNYSVAKTVEKGTKVEKISESNGWAKIKHQGIIRYCSARYLTKNNVSNTNTSSASSDKSIYYVNAEVLNVRTQPTTASLNIYKKINRGTKVTVVEHRKDGWSKILMDGKYMYISSSYISTKKTDINVNPNVTKKYEVTATTPTTSSAKNSIYNLNIAFKKMNGKVVNPGETFSYLNAIGKIDRDNGYIESGTISNGKPSTGVGGGVCQGSTTLHNAVMKAGLKIVERRNHSLPSKYAGKGMDAMVTGNLDYKFKNTSKYPIIIRAYVSGENAVVTLESSGDITGGYKFVPRVEVSLDGLKATTYLKKIKDGVVISEEIIARSTYLKK